VASNALAPGEALGLPDVVVYTPGAKELEAELRARIAAGGFTWDWRPLAADPGLALVVLFSDLASQVARRVRQLPEKARLELLRTAGFEALPATPARALVCFDVDPTATDPVVIPQGLQISGRPPGGDLVIFETERNVVGAPGKLAEVLAAHGRGSRDLTALNADPEASFEPFGFRPQVGDALMLGIDGSGAPAGNLSLAIGVTVPPGAPRPQSEGGLEPRLPDDDARLSWEAFDGSRWVSAQPVLDETARLSRTGVVQLALPLSFQPGRPAVAGKGDPRRWVRVRLVSGDFAAAPRLDFVRLNGVFASAGRTVRDEVLSALLNTEGRRFALAQRPVAQGSLTLDVTVGDVTRTWTEQPLLEDFGPDDAVYTFDPVAAEVQFGDGVNGRQVPDGATVTARAYRVLPTADSGLLAHALKSLVDAPASVTAVDNPRTAEGGDPQESPAGTAERGPGLIRTHGRTVLSADYEVLALRSEGAKVRRVHAMPGLRSVTGRPEPGVVGLVVVPPIDPSRPDVPPVPDEQALRNVARYLASKLAPAGVEIVAAPPVYRAIRVEAQVVLDPLADAGKVVTAALQTVRSFLHPLEGGDDGEGWPFGGALRYEALLRRLLAVKGVLRVPRLSYLVDGRRALPCADFALGPHELFWPLATLVLPLAEGE
jgi:predicted phage baseplate assembly protein